MRIAFFSTKPYDVNAFTPYQSTQHHFTFISHGLDDDTALLAHGYDAVCLFVNDQADAKALEVLHRGGTRAIALRCAGYNNVDLQKAKELGIVVVRVPAYSPEAIAEFTVGTILTVVRKYHKAYNRVREGNFLLHGLVGRNLQGKTIGIIGTGKIGMKTGRILSHGFGCHVLAHDPFPNEPEATAAGIKYVPLDALLAQSDIISLHCPLLESTKYILNVESLALTKAGVILINTSRGALIDTDALIHNLKKGHIAAVGLDVYEREEEYFFKDGSSEVMHDDVFSRLLSFHNVFVTGHQAFLTEEALEAIARTTVENLTTIEKGEICDNRVSA